MDLRDRLDHFCRRLLSLLLPRDIFQLGLFGKSGEVENAYTENECHALSYSEREGWFLFLLLSPSSLSAYPPPQKKQQRECAPSARSRYALGRSCGCPAATNTSSTLPASDRCPSLHQTTTNNQQPTTTNNNQQPTTITWWPESASSSASAPPPAVGLREPLVPARPERGAARGSRQPDCLQQRATARLGLPQIAGLGGFPVPLLHPPMVRLPHQPHQHRFGSSPSLCSFPGLACDELFPHSLPSLAAISGCSSRWVERIDNSLFTRVAEGASLRSLLSFGCHDLTTGPCETTIKQKM